MNKRVEIKKKSLVLLLAAACAAGAKTVDVTEFGAVPDGKTDNTAAIQKAIDVCAEAGGGTVRVAGGAFMTYTLHPRSNTRLEIAAGASLDGGPDPLKYPEFEPSPCWNAPKGTGLNGAKLSAISCLNHNLARNPNPF